VETRPRHGITCIEWGWILTQIVRLWNLELPPQRRRAYRRPPWVPASDLATKPLCFYYITGLGPVLAVTRLRCGMPVFDAGMRARQIR